MSDIDFTLHAAIDGELDAMGALEFERALAADPALATRFAQMKALREAMRGNAEAMRAPDALRANIAAMANAGDARPAAEKRASFINRHPRAALAAAMALAFFLGAMGPKLIGLMTPGGPERVAMLLVDDHRRALLAREPIDVASSDRHTVKPWFDARLALSPPVVDLAERGYALIGGRADVVDGAPVPTIVYRLREHLVSITALPASRFHSAAGHEVINGYEAMSWSDGAFVYWAIADLPRADLEAFGAAFRAAAANENSR